ncbi:MAG: site-specific DNA-methyltransferase [Hymenobacter sp.]
MPAAPASGGEDEEVSGGTSFTKQPSVIEQVAYRDTWGRGLDSYLQWFYETVVILRDLLTEDGSIYVHLDHHVGHYAKIILDEVFGFDNFVNEIIWKRQTSKGGAYGTLKQFGRIHETVLFYSKSSSFVWNQQHTEYSEQYLANSYGKKENVNGEDKSYSLRDLSAAGPRNGPSGSFIVIEGEKINPPPGRHWAVGIQGDETVQEAVNRLYLQGRISYKKGKVPRLKMYLDQMKGNPLNTLWTDILPVQAQGTERVNYATQKPEALLERIIKASSNEGDIVLDCFCGSGTTAATAEKLGRRWVTCDLGRFAIHTARKRLLGIEGVKPFAVQNLGKYERQQWLAHQFSEPQQRAAQEEAYRAFMLALYHAEVLPGYAWLHGRKGKALVHIGSVDAPVTEGDVKAALKEFWQAVGQPGGPQTATLHILGWEFAFDLNDTASRMAAQHKVQLSFYQIPREVLEKGRGPGRHHVCRAGLRGRKSDQEGPQRELAPERLRDEPRRRARAGPPGHYALEPVRGLLGRGLGLSGRHLS